MEQVHFELLKRVSVPYLENAISLREQSFLIPGTNAEDFWQGYENFFYHFAGVRRF